MRSKCNHWLNFLTLTDTGDKFVAFNKLIIESPYLKLSQIVCIKALYHCYSMVSTLLNR